MQTGIVFDIEHYGVHDGPGIRTVVFLKGCPLKCPWCCNPESQRFAPELRHAAARCRRCHSCRDACSRGAIEAAPGSPPIFNRRTCGPCGLVCVDACAHGALTVAGERMTTERVIARVAADKRFYDNSGGGVTFSGGEPFAQPAFLEDLLVESKRLGIHTAVETCGLADPVVVARCEPLVDLFLYDVKVVDRERHQQLTGMSNALILKNLRALAERARGKLAVRVPIIPGCTDDVRNVEEVAALLRSVGVRSAELMPYHSLGADKYASLGRDYLLSVALDVTARAVENVERVFATIGIECNVS